MKKLAILLLTLNCLLTPLRSAVAMGDAATPLSEREKEELSGFHDSKIARQCRLLAEPSDSKSSAQRATDAATLAGYLIERLRNKGGLNGNSSSQDMSSAEYEEQCAKVIQSVVDASKNVSGNNDFTLHAQQLLNYAQAIHQPEQDDEVILAIRRSQWLYHNLLDQHIQAENVARLTINNLIKSKLDDNQRRYFSTLISTSLMRQGRFAEAQKFLREALVIAEKTSSDLDQAYVWFSLGFLYRDLGEYEVAERYFRKNLTVREEAEGKVNLSASPCRAPSEYLRTGSTLTQLGIILDHQGKHEQASTYFTCALDIFGKGRDYYEIVARLAAAQNQFNLDNYTDSISSIDEVLAFEFLLTPQKLDAMLVKLESLLKLKNNLEAAQKTASEIAKILGYGDFYNHQNLTKNIKDYPVQQVNAFRLLIELSELTGKKQWLKPFSEKGFQIIQQYQHEVTNPQAWNAARYDLIKSYLTASFNFQRKLNDSQTEEIFQILEDYYSVDLSSEKNTFKANYGNLDDPQELNTLYQKWLDAEHDLVSAKQANDELKTRVDLARDAYLSYRSEKQFAVETGLPQLNLAETQLHMPKSDVLVRYFVNGSQSFVLLVSKDEYEIRAIPDEKDIVQFSQLLPEAIQQDTFHTLNKSAFMQRLLPLDGFIQAHHEKLVLIPDSVLHRLPFSVINLKRTSGKAQHNAEHLQIVRTHSASQYYAQQPIETFEYANNLAIFANPLLSLEDKINASVSALNRQWLSEMGALPGSMLEANYIRQLFPNQKILFGTGEKANKAFLTQDTTRDSKILHIATHGYYQQNSPDIVGLVTSKTDTDGEVRPGFLSINELLSQPINSQLVVISGCDTMMGKYYKSSGMRSITRGFLAQGAQSVIGTLWPVQDKATAEFMRKFYQALKNNHGDSAKALQLTKQQFASRGRYRQPKYWAGFALTANNHQAEKIELSNNATLLTTGISY